MVGSIEQYALEQDDEFYDFIETLKQSANQQVKKQNKAREYTTIKAAFQFFLQINHDGYFLDTNVIPNPTFMEPELPKYARFTFPYVDEPGDELQIDPWLMFSPKNERKAEARFNEYFILARKEFHARKSLDQIDRGELGQAFIDAAAFSHGAHKLTKLVSREKEGLCVSIGAFQKRYYNTHKLHGPNAHFLFELISGKPSLDELNYILHTSNLDTSAIEELLEEGTELKTTLLHHACYSNKPDELAILLPFAQNPNVSAQLSSEHEAAPLINAVRSTVCLHTIINFYLNKHFSQDNFIFKETLLFIMDLLDKAITSANRHRIEQVENEKLISTIIHFKNPRLHSLIKQSLNVLLPLGPITPDSMVQYVQALSPHYSPEQINTYNLLAWMSKSTAAYYKSQELTTKLEKFGGFSNQLIEFK